MHSDSEIETFIKRVRDWAESQALPPTRDDVIELANRALASFADPNSSKEPFSLLVAQFVAKAAMAGIQDYIRDA